MFEGGGTENEDAQPMGKHLGLTKGLVMVPRWCNAMIMQSLQRSRQLVLVLRRVLVNARLQFLGGARQALAEDARRVRKDVMGP